MVLLVFSLVGGFGGFFYGGVRPGVSPINDAVASELPGFEKTIYVNGGSGYGIINGFLIGGGGFGGTLTSESSTMHGELSYSSGFFEVGYIKPLFKFSYGFLTIGSGSVGMTMKLNRILSDVSFDSLLTDPGRRTTLVTSGMCFTAGAGVLFKLSKFFMLGVKVGYLYSPQHPDWKLDDGHQVLGGPQVKLSAPYASINFYFGSSDEE